MQQRKTSLVFLFTLFLFGLFSVPIEAKVSNNKDDKSLKTTFVQNEGPERSPDQDLPDLENKKEPDQIPAEMPPRSPIGLEKRERPNIEGIPEELLVEVEPSNIIPVDLTGGFYMVPYQIRRRKWGTTFGVSMSMFDPQKYEPDELNADFADVYGSADVPLLEVHMNIKRNYSFGSLGFDIGVGTYQTTSEDESIADSILKLIPVRFGGVFSLDNLWLEPLFVPYVAAGTYTVFYNETRSARSFNGNTQASIYATVGIMFQMDWIDRQTARDAYQESGIENTFLFVEGRMFMASQLESDPDFESLHASGGFKLEF